MNFVLLTNKSTHKIVIPELGLNLPCRGSTAVCLKQEWDNNPASAPYRSLISATILNRPPSVPISTRSTISVAEAPIAENNETPLPKPFYDMFSSMMQKIEELTTIVRKSEIATTKPKNDSVHVKSEPYTDVVASPGVVDFIPKTIVPDLEVKNMKSNLSTSDNADVEESTTALRKLRKKK